MPRPDIFHLINIIDEKQACEYELNMLVLMALSFYKFCYFSINRRFI